MFTRAGGSLSPVAWQFEQRGLISHPAEGGTRTRCRWPPSTPARSTSARPRAAAILVVTEPAELERVRSALTDAGFAPESAEVSMEPTTKVEIGDEKGRKAVLDFVERLEDLDDVQNVYANFDIPDALMEQLEASVVGG